MALSNLHNKIYVTYFIFFPQNVVFTLLSSSGSSLLLPEQVKGRGRCRSLLPVHQWQDTREQHKAAMDIKKNFFTVMVVKR